MNTVSRAQWRWKSILAIAGLIIAGLLSLVVSNNLKSTFWASFFGQLSTALLVGGLWTGVYELFLRRDFMQINDDNRDVLLDKIALAESEKQLGFEKIIDDSYNYDFHLLIEESKSLTIVMNDGRTWISRHNEMLQRRFADPDKKTVIFFLHPDSPMLDVLARKVDSTRDNLKAKIMESLSMLRQIAQGNAQLEVYGHHLYNPMTTFLGDDQAVITLYFTARGRKTVPALVFDDHEGTSFVKKIRDDVKDLLNDAECLPLGQPPAAEPKCE